MYKHDRSLCVIHTFKPTSEAPIAVIRPLFVTRHGYSCVLIGLDCSQPCISFLDRSRGGGEAASPPLTGGGGTAGAEVAAGKARKSGFPSTRLSGLDGN